MRRIKLIHFLFLFIMLLSGLVYPGHLKAQHGSSPEVLLSKPILTEKEIDKLDDYSFELRNINVDSSYLLGKKMLAASKLLGNYPNGVQNAHMRMGTAEKNRGNFDKVDYHLKIAFTIRDSLKNYNGAGSVLNTWANAKLLEGVAFRAKELYLKSLAYYRKAQRPDKYARAWFGIGIAEREIGNYESSVIYLDSAINTYLNNDNSAVDLADSYIAMGNTMIKMGNADKAVEYLEEAQRIFKKNPEKNIRIKKTNTYRCHYGLARAYEEKGDYHTMDSLLNLADDHASMLTKDERFNLYNSIGVNANKLSDYQRSIIYLDSARLQLDTSKQITDYCTVLLNKSDLFYNQKKDAEAIGILLHLIDKLAYVDNASIEKKAYNNLANLYRRNNQFQLADFNQLKRDSIQEKLGQETIEAYKLQNELDATRSELKIEKQKSAIAALNSRNTIVVLVALLVIFALATALILRNKKIQEQELEFKALQENIEKENFNTKLEMEEKTRRRIAQDIHDGLGGILATIKLNLSQMHSRLDEIQATNKQQFLSAYAAMEKAVVEVRRVSHALESGDKNHFGLEDELEDLVKLVSTKENLNVDLNLHQIKGQLNGNMALNIFRIIQELVNNTIKHAKATEIAIDLNNFGDVLNLVYEDNGIGFDPKKAMSKKGIGLKGMEARAKKLGGTLKIDSQKDRGTTVLLDIPLKVDKD